jgi:hypothetical protein
MRRFLTAVQPRVRAWWVLPLALLTLPNCAQIIGIEPWQDPVTDPGEGPRTSVIFCDIIQPPGRHCASQAEKDAGVRIEEAATALVSGQSNATALDYSQASQDKCGIGEPEAIPFQAPFPIGYAGCLNCGQIGSTYPDATAFCLSTCMDLAGNQSSFCQSTGIVSISTNFIPDAGSACIGNACLDEGTISAGFPDQRIHPETVDWQNQVNVSASGGTLDKTAGDGTQFDAGADAPNQTITHGNAYVQFTATGTVTTRLCGFTEGATGDTTVDYTQINFALDLFKDGHIYVYELGAKALGPDSDPLTLNSFGPYDDGQVFRVTVKDNLDGTGAFAPMGGTATVTYTRLTGSCTDGNVCPEELLWTSQSVAHYPLRVDSSLREVGAELKDVHVVRIR